MNQYTTERLSASKPNNLLPSTQQKALEQINHHAAGIDVGSRSHFVCVPENRDEKPVREFQSFTEDLEAMAAWLKSCGIETIAMESTGVYWVPVYEILVEHGFEVKLVDARQVKNVSGRKTDVLDCQWLQQLHTYGLLSGAFIPELSIRELRAYLRQRDRLIMNAATHIQHMQKALSQMNLQLHNVVDDITGVTGMTIIRAIIHGERDASILAQYRDKRCKNTKETIQKSLVGHYRPEHIFSLQQAVELYDIYQEKVKACDLKIETQLQTFEPQVDLSEYDRQPIRVQSRRARKYAPDFDIRGHLIQMTGVDLMMIPGIHTVNALTVISVIGTDMRAWPTSKHFESWLGLSPGNKVSGGKRLTGRSKKTNNAAASALRLAAQSLHRNQSALGAYFRRLRGRIGAPKAITATARKLAERIYLMLKYKREYIEMGQDYYEKQYQNRIIKNLTAKAAQFGLAVVPQALVPNQTALSTPYGLVT
jgi:transposase